MSEHGEQCAFVEYVLNAYRNRDDFLRPLFFAVPNGMYAGGKTERGDFRGRTITRMKLEGYTPGVADILYLQPRGQYAFLAIEMKMHARAKALDGGLTPDQVEFISAAQAAGAHAIVAYGADDAIRAFDDYMALPVAVKERQIEVGA